MIVKVIVRQLQGQFLGQIEEQMAEQREDQIYRNYKSGIEAEEIICTLATEKIKSY